MKNVKILIALTSATLTLAALTTTASANHLSSSTQTFRTTWSVFEFAGGFASLKCSLTLEGSLHSRTIAKVLGTLIGSITRASIGPCQTGSATVLTATLPWHIRYNGFTGVLPDITRLKETITNFQLRIGEGVFGITCLARAEPNEPADAVYALNGSHAVTSWTLGGTINCEGISLTLSGSSTTNSGQTITLI